MLTKHYPDRLLSSPEFFEFQEALGAVVHRLRSDLYSFGDQLSAGTATWGLCAWERALGIPVDVSKSDTERRSLIMSKLRGVGTVTADMIANIAQSFVEGEVTVREVPERASIVVKFVGELGIPSGIELVKAAIDEIKPAHLAVEYEYSYLLIRDVHHAMTINELNSTPLYKFAGGSGQ